MVGAVEEYGRVGELNNGLETAMNGFESRGSRATTTKQQPRRQDEEESEWYEEEIDDDLKLCYALNRYILLIVINSTTMKGKRGLMLCCLILNSMKRAASRGKQVSGDSSHRYKAFREGNLCSVRFHVG